MRILIVSAVFPPEPVVSSLISFDLANALASDGNNVTVICPQPTRPFGYDFENGTNVSNSFKKIVLNSYVFPKSKILGRFKESLSFGKHCFNFVKENHRDFDVIYANTWPLFAQFFLVKASAQFNTPVILHIQDIYPEAIAEKQSKLIKWFFLLVFRPLDRLILRKCSKVITISEPMKNYLVRTRNIDFKKVFVVRNWQNDEVFRNALRKNKTDNLEFVFMYLGSINPSASVETLIHSFGIAKLDNCKLIIAGEGPNLSECIKLAQQYPDLKIEFLPASTENVFNIQRNADILLLPLKKGIAKTATPSKLTAYMFSGKPIIACIDSESDAANHIRQSNCGWIVAPQNIDILAQTMNQVYLMSKQELSFLGHNGYEYALSNFSKEQNLMKLINIILD